MKKLKTLTLSLLLGVSTAAFAAENPVQTTESTAVEQVEKENVIAKANTVNINTATAAELQDKLIGIGEKKAQAIVDYRTKNGNFKSIEQLAEVSGIGNATIDKNRANIVLE